MQNRRKYFLIYVERHCFLMPKEKGIKQTYFMDDMEIMSLSYNPSSSGIIVAFRNKQGIDFHLTIYYKNLSLISHVVYNNKITGESYRSPDSELNLQEFLEYLIGELGDSFILSLDEHAMCHTFTDGYLEFMLGKNTEDGDQEVNVMNAFQVISSEPDFSNLEHFQLVKTSQLPKICPLGFINVDTEPKVIIPISKDQVAVIPDDFIERTFDIITDGLGLNTFFEELDRRLEKS